MFLRITDPLLAGWASITLAVVFNDFTCGGNELQITADILFTDQEHLRAAYRAALLLFRN